MAAMSRSAVAMVIADGTTVQHSGLWGKRNRTSDGSLSSNVYAPAAAMSRSAVAMAIADGTMVHLRPRRSDTRLAGRMTRKLTTAMPANTKPALPKHT